MIWHSDFDWIFNLVTITWFGVIAAIKCWAVWSRSQGRRRDRLIWGLSGWNGYLAIAFVWSAWDRLTGGLPTDHLLQRSVLRTAGIVFGTIVIFALKTAPPLWEPQAMNDLRQRLAEMENTHAATLRENEELVAANERLKELKGGAV